MELELRFEGLTEDVIDPVADIAVVDLGMADVPGPLAETLARAATVSSARPSVLVTVDVPVAGSAYEPGLVVRVRGRTAAGEQVEFLNTDATPLPGHPAGPVRVVLSRIR
jgi:hypothetical protein